MDFGGEARESIPAVFSDEEEMEIGFNARYVTEALQHIDAEQVSFLFSAPTRAGLMMPEGEQGELDILMLVMPLRLNA